MGVGGRVKRSLRKLGSNPDMRAQKLNEDDIGRINALLQSQYVVEGDLRRQIQNNIKRLISIHAIEECAIV